MLFDLEQITKDVTAQVNTTKSRAVRKSTNSASVLGKALSRVQEVIGTVTMGESLHYVSIGEWSMHDILFHLLSQTGPADVYIATWSVSEDAVRQLIQKVTDGSITRLYGILDWRVKVRRPEAFELARFNVADLRLTTCHAKVTVIRNEAWGIAIVGSANYTNNPRIEAGVIACDFDVASFHQDWMASEILKADPFETQKTRRNE